MLTREDIYNYVSIFNGGNDISVEFTEVASAPGKNSDLDESILKAIEVYNRYRPKLHEFTFVVLANKQNYQLPREQVGRGVWRYVPKQSVSDSYKQFPSSYYPVNYPGYAIKSADLMVFRTVISTERKILGSWDDFKYNPDSNTLTIYPIPLQSFAAVLECLHDRLFTVTNLFTTSGNTQTIYTTQVVNSNGLPVVNLVPGSIKVTIGTIELVDNYSGVLVSPNNGTTGVIDYQRGTITITFAQVPNPQLTARLSVCEVRTEDYNWFKDYVLALAKIIIGRKRKHFGGKIPGAQTDIDLDVDILTEGTEEKEKLEKKAENWMAAWVIPRIQ